MPLTPRSYADFKECLGNFKSDLVDFKEGLTDLADFKSDLIELIKLPYTDIIDINYPFFINDRVFIGYGFSLKDDIDIICDQIYKKEKSSALLNSIKKTILDFKKDTTKSDYENSILLYERINKATNDLKRLPSLSEPTKSISSSLLKNQSSLNNKTSNNEIINKEINNNKTNNTLPEFKFILDSQKDAILEQKLKPLITQINKKLSGSPLGNLQDITLSTNKSSINKTTPYNSKTTLLNNTHSTDKTTIPTNQSSTPKIYKEHIALLAFLYLSDTRELSPSLITYIKSKNRFRAWYFLAYESFEGKDEFINIRDRISSKFGLYEYDEYNNKSYLKFEQVVSGFFDGDDYITNYYGTNISPSFNCYDTKGKYKFKKYSLEYFICQSYILAFIDNYFADLYNLIIKENPSLKDKAIKIARDRIKESKKECVIYSKEQYDYGFFVKIL